MKRCAYCGRDNDDAATVCSGCGTTRLQSRHSLARARAEAHPEPPRTSRRRGIKFLVGGLLGGTVLVVMFSAAFDDWSYLTRWVSGVVGIGLVVAYKLGKRLAFRVVEQQVRDDLPLKPGPDA